jgi:hypothetical protein
MNQPEEPKAKITLKHADEGDRVIWVYETAEEVAEKVNAAKSGGVTLIRLSRFKRFQEWEFHTRPDNIASIEELDYGQKK